MYAKNTLSPKSSKALRAKKNLESLANEINSLLKKYFDSEISNAFAVDPEGKKLATHLLKHVKEHCLRPAKRLRASFVVYGYKLLEGKRNGPILNASISIELVHTALLIHDDFMDQDDTRRGLPATHKYYESYHQKSKFHYDPTHYGESMAVDAGDLALCLGFETLGKSSFKSETKLRALNRLLRGIANTAHGQAFDVTLESRGKAKEKDIINLHHAKTAIYTYENPIHMGAILAGATSSDLNLLSKYAIPGGIAFQLQDDILGLFGDPIKTGKPAHSDLRQGKMTLLIIKALEKATKEEKKVLKGIWGNRNLTEKDADLAREIVVKTGSLEYSKNLAVKWAKKAQKAMPLMKKKKWSGKAIDYLDGIAQYMVEREF